MIAVRRARGRLASADHLGRRARPGDRDARGRSVASAREPAGREASVSPQPGVLAQRGVGLGHEPRRAAADHGDPLARLRQRVGDRGQQRRAPGARRRGWRRISRADVVTSVSSFRTVRAGRASAGRRCRPARRRRRGPGDARRGAGTPRVEPRRHESRNAASKVSPAPVVSTATTATAGLAQHVGPSGSTAKAPSAPSLTTTSGPRCGERRGRRLDVAARSRSAGRPAPAPRRGWAAARRGAAAASSTPCPLAGRVVVGVQRRGQARPRAPRRAARAARRASRGCRKSEADVHVPGTGRGPRSSALLDFVRRQRGDRAGEGQDRAVVRRPRARRSGRSPRPASTQQRPTCDAGRRRAAARTRSPKASSPTAATSATGRPEPGQPVGGDRRRAADQQRRPRRAAARPGRTGGRRRRAGSGRGWRRRPRARRSRSVSLHAIAATKCPESISMR